MKTRINLQNLFTKTIEIKTFCKSTLFLTCFILFAFVISATAQLNTSSSTYTAGDVNTDENPTGDSSCPEQLTVNIPSGKFINSVDVSYSMTGQNAAWASDQRSFIRAVGDDDTPIQTNSVNNTGTVDYNLTGLTIANNITGGTTLINF